MRDRLLEQYINEYADMAVMSGGAGWRGWAVGGRAGWAGKVFFVCDGDGELGMWREMWFVKWGLGLVEEGWR